MSQDQGSSAATGCLIAAVVVVVLVVCGGGALIMAGALIFVRDSRNAGPNVAPPPPAVAAHADVLAIDADGTLLWNDEQVMKAELASRLDEVKNAAGPPRSIIVRVNRAAPPASRDEVLQIINDRGLGYIEESIP
jgi:biopolymer transport protein ExbD